ncbi:MAG: S8 family serine peptidase [Bdellovibrionales bacterium]|nr:S8 family serine peptidase [Bdellovibrionales bacterium]
MLKKIFSFTLVLAFIYSAYAASEGTTYIAVLDSPVDYQHPEISAVLDEELLKEAKIVDEKGQEKSWYDLNLEAKAEFEKRLNKKQYAEQVQFLDSIHMMLGGNIPSDKALATLSAVAKGAIKYIFSPKFRSGLNVVGTYLHGTHVAGIAMRSLTNVRLINFPLITPSKQLTISDILKFDPAKQREDLRRHLDQISQVLKQQNIRVVNLSVGTSGEIAFKSAKNRSTFFQKLFLRGKIKEMAEQGAKIFAEEMRGFFKANPESVFVLAAGNEKRDLRKIGDHTANIEAGNLIKVAAIDGKGKIASFSNRSSSYVDIAAIGTGVTSALVGGSEMHMSGTSQAAPSVANTLARIFESNPQMSSADAIEALYSRYTTSDSTLADMVANGRVLKSSPETERFSAEKATYELTGQVSQSEISRVIMQYSQQVVEKRLSSLDLTIMKGGVEALTINIKNANGKIDVSIVEIPTAADGTPKVARHSASSSAKSCQALFLGL